MSNPDGSDRVCLVTGAARGNGLAIARALTDSGATVYLADIARDLPDVPYALATPREFDEAVESLQTIHNRVYGIRFDVRDAKAAARAVTQIETEQGRLDILVNNAGVLVLNPIGQVSEGEWNVQMDTIVKGAFYLCRAALPGMNRRGWGRIVNVSSIAGHRGLGTATVYTAAKHALIGLTRSLAMEVARQGITINAVCPGTVPTPLVEGTGRTLGLTMEETLTQFTQRHLTENPIAPEDVAAAVGWLASDAASRVNGASLFVDDGWHCH